MGPEYVSRQFSYTAATRIFSAEASDLGLHAGTEPGEQVFPDACDVGFTIISEVTGKKVRFTLSETKKDRDGDIQYWKFTSYPRDLPRDVPSMYVIIFND